MSSVVRDSVKQIARGNDTFISGHAILDSQILMNGYYYYTIKVKSNGSAIPMVRMSIPNVKLESPINLTEVSVQKMNDIWSIVQQGDVASDAIYTDRTGYYGRGGNGVISDAELREKEAELIIQESIALEAIAKAKLELSIRVTAIDDPASGLIKIAKNDMIVLMDNKDTSLKNVIEQSGSTLNTNITSAKTAVTNSIFTTYITPINQSLGTINSSDINLAGSLANVQKIARDGNTAINFKLDVATLKASTGYTSFVTWDFIDNVNGWIGAGASLTYESASKVRLTSTTTDPILQSPVLSLATNTAGDVLFDPRIKGKEFNVIRARIKRVAGTGWEGLFFYAIATRSFDGAYYTSVPVDPTLGMDWVVVEWDIGPVSDWGNNLITQLRIDLGTTVNDVFLIDYVSVGKYAQSSVSTDIRNLQAATVTDNRARIQDISSVQATVTTLNGAKTVAGSVLNSVDLTLNAAGGTLSRVSSLETTINTPTTGVLARISSIESTSAGAGSATAARVDTLEVKIKGDPSNLVYNANFDDRLAQWSGAESIGLQWLASNSPGVPPNCPQGHMAMTTVRDFANLKATAVNVGDVLYYEAWVATSGDHGKQINLMLYAWYKAPDGVTTVQSFPVIASRLTNDATGTWKKISGYYTVPAGVNLIQPIFQMDVVTPNTDYNFRWFVTGAQLNSANDSGDVRARVEVVSQAAATADGKASAVYGVNLDVNGRVSGFKSVNNGPSSYFSITADKFLIYAPGTGDTPVFIVAPVNGTNKLALRGDMIIDGSITATKLAIGSGKNLLTNSSFEGGFYGYNWAFRGPGFLQSTITPSTYLWANGTSSCIEIIIAKGTVDAQVHFDTPSVRVKPSTSYWFQVAVASHRTGVRLEAIWLDSGKNYISTVTPVSRGDGTNNLNNAGASGFDVLNVKAVSPANAVYAIIKIVNGGTSNTTASADASYMWICEYMVEETTANATARSPYVRGGSTLIDGGLVQTNTINANSIIASTIRVTDANITGQINASKLAIIGNDGKLASTYINGNGIFTQGNVLSQNGFYVLKQFSNPTGNPDGSTPGTNDGTINAADDIRVAFGVDNTGRLVANNAKIKGTIEATEFIGTNSKLKGISEADKFMMRKVAGSNLDVALGETDGRYSISQIKGPFAVGSTSMDYPDYSNATMATYTTYFPPFEGSFVAQGIMSFDMANTRASGPGFAEFGVDIFYRGTLVAKVGSTPCTVAGLVDTRVAVPFFVTITGDLAGTPNLNGFTLIDFRLRIYNSRNLTFYYAGNCKINYSLLLVK